MPSLDPKAGTITGNNPAGSIVGYERQPPSARLTVRAKFPLAEASKVHTAIMVPGARGKAVLLP